jgi:hypothetical protein
MKDYSKEELKIYCWMLNALNLDHEIAYCYADVFKQTDEGRHRTVIDLDELKFWTQEKDNEAVLKKLGKLAKADLISIEVENGAFIVGIKKACREILVNRKNKIEILNQLKNETYGIDIAIIYTKMCIASYKTHDVLYIDRFSSVKDCLAEGLDEKPEDIENALEVLKRLDAIDY